VHLKLFCKVQSLSPRRYGCLSP